MKLYLDNSFVNRFFDDPSIGAHKLEREVLLRILSHALDGQIQLVHSSVIAFENGRNPFPQRKQFVEQVMQSASMFQSYTETAHERAEQLVSERTFSLYDARHIAVAETAQVDFFLTCDYDLITQNRHPMGTTPVKSACNAAIASAARR